MIWRNYIWRMRAREGKWIRWFAWYPVEIGDYLRPTGETAWFEWVERRVALWGDGECPDRYDYRKLAE